MTATRTCAVILCFFSVTASAQQPGLVLPLGHAGAVRDVCFSPDGKLAVTNAGQEEVQVKIWEVGTGKLIRTIDAHAEKISSVTFSPDGKYLLTTGRDHRAKVWDMRTGELYYDIYYNSTNWIDKGYFTADGKKVLLVSRDAMEYFDLQTKKLIHPLFDTSSYQVNGDGSKWRHAFEKIDVNASKELAVTTGSDSTIRVWDLAKGKIILQIKEPGTGYYSCDLNSTGNLFLASTLGRSIHIWETMTGNLVKTISTEERTAAFAAFSPDDQKIITTSTDDTSWKCPIDIWDLRSGKKEQTFNTPKGVFSLNVVPSPDGKQLLSFSSDGMIRLWEMASGKLLRIVSEMNPLYREGKDMLSESELANVIGAFSNDSKHIITASFNNIPVIQESLSGKIVAKLQGRTTLIYNPRYAPDGNYIATAGLKDNLEAGNLPAGVACLWDTRSGKLVFSLQGHSKPINDLKFSKDGEWLVTVSEDSTARIWDTRSGKLVRIFAGHERGVTDCFLTEDKKYLVTKPFSGTARAWDTETGKQLYQIRSDSFAVEKNGIYRIAPSRTGKFFMASFYDNPWTFIVETSTGKILQRFNTKKDSCGFFRFSPDEKTLVHQEKKQVIIRNIETGMIRATIAFQKAIMGITINHKGNLMAVATRDTVISLLDISTGKPTAELGGAAKGSIYIDFTSDDRFLTANAYDSTINIWDLTGTKQVKRLRIGRDDMYGFNVTRNGRYYMFTRSFENVMKVWDMANGQLLTSTLDKYNSNLDYNLHPTKAQFIVDSKFSNEIYNIGSSLPALKIIPVSNIDYLTIDSAGRYDGTEVARKLLYFTCGTEIIELDQAKDQLWVPNLAERIANGETINAKTLYELNICGLTPEIKDGSSKTGEYLFKIKPRRGGLGEIVLYVNGIEAQRYKPSQLMKNGEWYDLLVKKETLEKFFIAGQENRVTAKAYTTGNAVSSRGAVVISKEEQKPAATPNFYAVMIGVSDYKGDELDLKYAAKDATDISNAIALSARKLLNTDGKEHVFIYNLTTTKERYQLPEKNAVKILLAEIGKKAMAADVLLIFFAGHGIMAGEGDRKQFYFLTADASTLASTAAVKDVGISTAELTEWMKPQNIKAQKRILVFDACNSGQAIKDFVKMGSGDQNYIAARNDDKSQLVKAIDKLNEKSGLFILSASASDQSAYEMGRYSQGLLTYSLLKAIKQQPDILEDGKYLNISRWFNAAEKTVVEISRETGARQEPQIVSTTNFNIGLVDEEVMGKIVLPQEKPLFAASNFQNSDEAIADDDLELSKLVNLGLSDLSTRGADSRIVYVTATNSPDAYSLSGRFSVKGNTITITVNVKQNKLIKNKFEISGPKDKLNELVTGLINKVTALLPN